MKLGPVPDHKMKAETVAQKHPVAPLLELGLWLLVWQLQASARLLEPWVHFAQVQVSPKLEAVETAGSSTNMYTQPLQT